MIGLDTNVLVRYIAQDDPEQSAIATAFINQLSRAAPGFVTIVSIIEVVWVMQSCYMATKPQITAILEKLISSQELVIENAETVIKALELFSVSKADFTDCLIERSAHHAGCSHTVTFDQLSAKTAGMRKLS